MMTHTAAIWILTGLSAGWAVRVAMRSHLDYGLLGDLTIGSLGALIGGWLLRKLGVWTPDNVAGHVLVALIGAAVLLAGVRLIWHLVAKAGLVSTSEPTPGPGGFDERLRHASDWERRLLAKSLSRRHASVDVNKVYDAQLTAGERVADAVAAFGGSWVFIGMFFAAMIVWMAVNEDMAKPFDPYPFILLNLILSCLAAVQAPIIMMSQNRQAAKDRIDARNDFEVNLRAEMEIMGLHEKLDQMQLRQLQALIQLVEEQGRRLESLEQIHGTRPHELPPDAQRNRPTRGDHPGCTDLPVNEI